MSESFETDERLKHLEDRVAKLELGQQRSYSIIAKAWPEGESFFKRDLTLDECQYYFNDLMGETGRFEDWDGGVHTPSTLKNWSIEAVFGPDGDCLEEFQMWYVRNANENVYVPLSANTPQHMMRRSASPLTSASIPQSANPDENRL